MTIAEIARCRIVNEEIADRMKREYNHDVQVGSPMTREIVRALSSAEVARDLPSD